MGQVSELASLQSMSRGRVSLADEEALRAGLWLHSCWLLPRHAFQGSAWALCLSAEPGVPLGSHSWCSGASPMAVPIQPTMGAGAAEVMVVQRPLQLPGSVGTAGRVELGASWDCLALRPWSLSKNAENLWAEYTSPAADGLCRGVSLKNRRKHAVASGESEAGKNAETNLSALRSISFLAAHRI